MYYPNFKIGIITISIVSNCPDLILNFMFCFNAYFLAKINNFFSLNFYINSKCFDLFAENIFSPFSPQVPLEASRGVTAS